MPLLDVRDPVTKKLLFRYDPIENIVQIKREHGNLREIHLTTLAEQFFKMQSTLSVPNADKENATERRDTTQCLESTVIASTGA